jgi:hypothetical protein
MTASEDPVSQPSSEAAGADQPRDDLEHWLSDLRTEPGAGSSGWADEDSGGDRPASPAAERTAPAAERREAAEISQPNGGGRHRAAD